MFCMHGYKCKSCQIYMQDAELAELNGKSDLYILSYHHFYSKNCPFSMKFHSNLKKFKTDFSFVLAHCASFMKMGSKLRGGVCISLVGTAETPNGTKRICDFLV